MITNKQMKAEMLARIEGQLAAISHNLDTLEALDASLGSDMGDLHDQLDTMVRSHAGLLDATLRAKKVNGS